MSKKSSPNKPSYLSPENYIRQKSRNLPLGDCFINPNWESCKMCQVLITRLHVTGNVTSCMYLVDLNLLGVKDTFFKFNIPFDETMAFYQRSDVEFVKISYALAHNIIYASIEFASEFGFNPHKDFTNITRHFLEDDNDEIPLIEIECGFNGKPMYTNTGFDSPERERAILRQLERSVGKDNFNFMLPGSADMYREDNELYEDDGRIPDSNTEE